MEPKILFEDNHLLVLNKPSGWLVQGDKTGDKTLTDWGKSYLKEKYQKPGNVFLHPCHRLDRPVSGIVIMARTSKALERMNKLFREDTIEKTYLAIVQSKPPKNSEKLIHWLIKNPQKNITKAYPKPGPDRKEAVLTYELLKTQRDISLLLVQPKTGRPHQIRVQLSKINCPIVGDLKYGYPDPNSDKSISLHAYRIKFVHPVKKEEIIINSIPEWQLFKKEINELD